MTQHASDREIRQGQPTAARPIPPFKAVALPALAAAVQAAKLQPRNTKTPKLPAILRKEAMLG